MLIHKALMKGKVRKIQKIKYSYSINIPVEIIKSLRWKEGQKVIIKKLGNRIVIKDWEK